MKISKSQIKQFELEQSEYGTRVALFNIFSSLFVDFMDIDKAHFETSSDNVDGHHCLCKNIRTKD